PVLFFHDDSDIRITNRTFKHPDHNLHAVFLGRDGVEYDIELIARFHLWEFDGVCGGHFWSGKIFKIKARAPGLCTGIDNGPFDVKSIIGFKGRVIKGPLMDYITRKLGFDNWNSATAAQNRAGRWDDHERGCRGDERCRAGQTNFSLGWKRGVGERDLGLLFSGLRFLRSDRQGNRFRDLALNLRWILGGSLRRGAGCQQDYDHNRGK